jgi:hypothetical protein
MRTFLLPHHAIRRHRETYSKIKHHEIHPLHTVCLDDRHASDLNWKDTIFNVVDNNSSVIDKVLHPLDVLKFNNTAESASFSVERLVWKAKYIYRASSPPKLSAVHTDS